MHAAELCAEWNIAPLLAAGADPRVADNAGRSALSGDLAPQGDPKCKRVRSLLESAVRAPDFRPYRGALQRLPRAAK